jgi:uncharacterized protein
MDSGKHINKLLKHIYMDLNSLSNIINENILLAKKGTFKKREIFDVAKSLLYVKQILSIVGVRRCGKSTLMKELVRIAMEETEEKNILYLNLEQPFFNQYKEDVNNLQKIFDFFYSTVDKRKKVFLFLDEIQFFNDWQVFIKSIYEKSDIKIVLTGSNSKLLSSELATILSGRNISLQMYPFSLKESGLNFDDYLIQGGFPEVIMQKETIRLLAETYYKNILYQDIIPRFNIQNVLGMENLSYYLISNTGKEISFNTLKNISQIDDKTIKQYISYLQDANLLYVIHNFDFSLKKLIGRKKKIYLVDPLFLQMSFKNSPNYGALFENYIYMFLKRKNYDIYFQKNGSECDFILKEGYKITKVIQVCFELNSENREREINGLVGALKKFDLVEGHIVTKNQTEKIVFDGMSIFVLSENKFRKKFGIDSEKFNT